MTMRNLLSTIIRQLAVAAVLFSAPAASAQPADAAVACAADVNVSSDTLIANCTPLIAAEATSAAVRTAALVVRAGAHEQIYQSSRDTAELDRALADYDAALKLDPRLAQAYANRGIAWRNKGDRVRAMADYSAALRLDPSLQAVAAQRKTLALEIEQLGALMPVQPPR